MTHGKSRQQTIDIFNQARRYVRIAFRKDIPKDWKMIIRLYIDEEVPFSGVSWTISFLMNTYSTSTQLEERYVSLRWWSGNMPNLNIYETKIIVKNKELDLDLFSLDLKAIKKIIKKIHPIITCDPINSLLFSSK